MFGVSDVASYRISSFAASFVAGFGASFAADFSQCRQSRFQMLWLAAGYRHFCAEARELSSDSFAQPAAAAGDQHDMAVECAGGQCRGADVGRLWKTLGF